MRVQRIANDNGHVQPLDRLKSMNQQNITPNKRPNRTALMFTINACMFIFGIVLFLMGALLP
jgi:hypothetical protein